LLVHERRSVVDVVPTSAQCRLCRPGGYADLDEDRLLSGGARAMMSA
jgi:hypothetical protein